MNLQIFNLTLSRMNNGGIGFVKKPPSERNGRSRFSGSVVQTHKINDKARSLDARFGIALCPLKTDSISASAKLRGYPADLASWIGPPVLGGFIAKADPPRTRTWNLRLRRPTPYPLGQRAIDFSNINSKLKSSPARAPRLMKSLHIDQLSKNKSAIV